METRSTVNNSSTAIWTPNPERVASTNLRRFQSWLKEHRGVECSDYESLHRWSVRYSEHFWAAAWDFFSIKGDRGERLMTSARSDADATDSAVVPDDDDSIGSGSNLDASPGTSSAPLFWKRFLPDARLNVAENLLGKPSDEIALIFRSEDGEASEFTRAELHDMTARCQQLLRESGVGPGDHVAAWMPNRPETQVIMLAAAGLGAVFSSASPDFGPAGVTDRFGQISPRVLFASPGYFYNGRRHDCSKRLTEISSGLPSLRRTVLVEPDWLDGYGSVQSDSTERSPTTPVTFHRLPFDHPWYVLYSSGTTGPPKCIVHRTGGLLLKHLVEQRLHCDVRPGDRVFYFTTTGWMMWNWLASALASRAVLVLYDGSPAWPDLNRMFDLIDETGITLFGTSAKFIDACSSAGIRPARTHTLASLRTITSTGSPLVPEGFDWVYDSVKSDVHLASISGGTDLCGCLVLGDPTAPVHRGEIQRPALGLDIDVTDESGVTQPVGTEGEMVCRNAFPSMPLRFASDPDDVRYRATYFEHIPGVWYHGDFANRTASGGFVISGRSDTTLNPGGVRIGTAEIYRRVDSLPEVAESVVAAQPWDADTRIVLFVRMASGHKMTDELRDSIRGRIRAEVSPRHVPTVIAEVPDIPRTRSGKITEAAVRDVISGRQVRNTSALANPESLVYFRDHPEVVRQS